MPLRFELISVHCGAQDLTGLFSLSSSTPDLLDYSLSFHLHHTLTFSALFPYSNYHHLLTSYVAKLEQLGLWQWAIYIVMQCSKMNRRHRIEMNEEKIVKDILDRHAAFLAADTTTIPATAVKIDSTPYYTSLSSAHYTTPSSLSDIEAFLINEVAVPSVWINSAKAHYYYYHQHYETACPY